MLTLGEYIDEITSFLNTKSGYQYTTDPLNFFGKENKNIKKIKLYKMLDEGKKVKIKIIVNDIEFISNSISYAELISMIINNYLSKNTGRAI